MAHERAARLTGTALAQRRAELTAAIERDLAGLALAALRTLALVAAAPPPEAARESLFERAPCHRPIGPWLRSPHFEASRAVA